MYIWFPYKTPDLSECPYNTPLLEVHKLFLGYDLDQFPFLLGFLYGFRITSRNSFVQRKSTAYCTHIKYKNTLICQTKNGRFLFS